MRISANKENRHLLYFDMSYYPLKFTVKHLSQSFIMSSRSLKFQWAFYQ